MAAPQHSPRLRDLTLRPTRLGLGLAVMVVLLWTVGLNYQVNLAYVVAFWLAGFLLVGVLLNCLQLLGLRLDITPPTEVFQGQTAEVLLHPTGGSARRHRLLWFTALDEDGGNSRPAEFGARHSRPFAWPILAKRRGRLQLPPLYCSSVFPFGISRAACVWHWPEEGLVYPAPLPHTPPPGRLPDDNGERRVHPGGREEPAYLLEHQPGRPLQQVAWKQFAKSGRLLDKHFEEPVCSPATDLISHADYPAATPADRLAGLLCHRVLEAHRHGRPYTLVLPARTIPPQHGQREKCLSALALL
ncbi:MAG: hypothetical protein Q4A62_03715 [Eikenella sp.]|nr:hypothetical protein [Eikenella sp.]